MTTMLDGCRRAASVVLVAVLLVLVPSVATARLTASRAPAALNVGTASMVTPSAITGSYTCTRSGNTESISVTVTRFTDGGPTGSTYDYGLAIGTTSYDTAASGSTTTGVALAGSKRDDKATTTWTVGIQSTRGSWTSGIGTVTIACPASGTKSGTL